MGNLGIERFAFAQQRLDARIHIVHLQQGSALVAAGAFDEQVRACLQIDDHAAFLHRTTVFRPQHGAAACRQHRARHFGRRLDGKLLAVAKAALAFLVEYPRDVHAGAFLHQLIGVAKLESKQFGQVAADGSLAHRHHAHQEDAGFVRLHLRDIMPVVPVYARFLERWTA